MGKDDRDATINELEGEVAEEQKNTEQVMREIKEDEDDDGDVDPDRLPLVERLPFNVFIGFIISLNAILIGVEADLYDPNKGKCISDRLEWYLVDVVFTVVFVLEALLRIHYLQMQYFHDPWNLIDFFLATMAIIDVFLVTPLLCSTNLRIFTVLRIMRLLKLVRMLKMVKIFANLHLIVKGLGNALRTLFWVTTMLGIFLYTCAVFMTIQVGHRDDLYNPYFMESQWDHEAYFGNVASSMLTLFQICTKDHWAEEVARHVIAVQPAMTWFFAMFVLFTTYGILNLVVGVIVERILAMSKQNKDRDYKRHMRDRQVALSHLRAAFEYMDEDGSGTLTLDELMKALDNPEISSRLRMVGFPMDDPEKIFMLLDVERSGELDLEQFLKGCTKMQGEAQSKDLLEVLVGVTQLGKQLDLLEEKVVIMHHKATQLDSKTENIVRRATEMFSDPARMKKLQRVHNIE